MTTFHRPHRRGARGGGAATEFALVAPILVLLTFGFMDYAIYFMAHEAVLSAAQQGVRSGAQTDPATGAPDAAAITVAERVLGATYPTSYMASDLRAQLVGDEKIVLEVTVQFEPLVGFVPVPHVISLSAEHPMEKH